MYPALPRFWMHLPAGLGYTPVRSLQSPSLYVSSTMAMPSALQLPLIQRSLAVVARHVLVLKLPLSTHFVQAASVQSFSLMDFHCVALSEAATIVAAAIRRASRIASRSRDDVVPRVNNAGLHY